MTTETPSQALTTQAKREIRVVQDNSEIAYLLDTARFDHCYRIAGAMARASLIPKHLKGQDMETTQANCFLVVNQALRWGLDPFAIAPETYEVGGKLGFSGKLVAAVINARGGLKEKLSYTFNDAKGGDLEITVSGTLEGETEPRTITAKVRDCQTQNQMWTKDPYQKLVYTGATKWARRHKPEVILGVMTDDDAESIREEERGEKIVAIGQLPQFAPNTATPPAIEIEAQPQPPAQSAPKPRAKREAKQHPPAHDTTKTQPVVAQEPPSTPPAAAEATPEPPADARDEFEQVVDGDLAPEPQELIDLRAAFPAAKVTEAQVLAYCHKAKVVREPITKLSELTPRIMGLLKDHLLAPESKIAPQIRGTVV